MNTGISLTIARHPDVLPAVCDDAIPNILDDGGNVVLYGDPRQGYDGESLVWALGLRSRRRHCGGIFQI
jgi:hypothetical protein